MSNKPVMRQAGRRLRRVFDNYVQALEEANAAGVSLTPERIISEALADGTTREFAEPDPSLVILSDPAYLKSVRFQYTFVERMTEDEVAADPATTPATPATGAGS